MTLIRRAVRMLNLIQQQNQLLSKQQAMIDRMLLERQTMLLEHQREMLGLVSAWRIHMETPETDLRDDISALAVTLGHQIAALEEHVVQ